MSQQNYLRGITDPSSVVTIFDSATRFPELIAERHQKYAGDVDLFGRLVANSTSIAELLDNIRDPARPANQRMSLLKIFRRCVAPALDTEMAKRIKIVNTNKIIERYAGYFKSIRKLKMQFSTLSDAQLSALVSLLGEYDTRGYQGYELTEHFFQWFEDRFRSSLIIEGPRRAGKDIELSTIFPEYQGNYPCDFVIREKAVHQGVCAIGFARYDSTRGGSQSDDRTGGNLNKVTKAQNFSLRTGARFRILFLSDGPGLIHRDTWKEACELDGSWSDNVRVTTLKLAARRVTTEWLLPRHVPSARNPHPL